MELVETGFQETEVGLIPLDWKSEKITSVSTEIFLGLTAKVDYVKYKGVPLIRASDIAKGRLDFSKVKTISLKQHKGLTKFRKAKRGDLLVSKSGSLGVCAIVNTDIEFSIYESIIVIQCIQSKLSSEFLIWLMRYNKTQQRILGEKVGSSVAHLNIEMFRKLVIPIPTLKEQKAIATALSDVDALIHSLEALIAKNKAIKQGAMQELLTGKTRLAGFEGDWTGLNLGESSILKARIGWQGLTTAEYLDSGEYFLVTGTDFKGGYIDWNNCVYVEKKRYDQDKNIQVQVNDILVTKDGTIGKVAFVDQVLIPTTLNSGVFVIRPVRTAYHPRFFYYILMSNHFTNFLNKLTAGSTISHLYQKDFVHFNFSIPPTLKEQKAIAETLSNIDKEIQALQTKKEKYQGIKQGMMQELLTGKTRLI